MEDAGSDQSLINLVRSAVKYAPRYQFGTVAYDNLIELLSVSPPFSNESKLATILQTLHEEVPYIDRVDHRSLLSAISKFSLWKVGQDTMDAWVHFVEHLATSRKECLDICLDMLVSNFIPPSCFLRTLKEPHGAERKEQVISVVHSLLSRIVDGVPLAPFRLERVVRDKIPNVYSREAPMVLYMENMLMLASSDMGELVGNSMILELVKTLIVLEGEIVWDEITWVDVDHSSGSSKKLEDIELVNKLKMDIDESQEEYAGVEAFYGYVSARKFDAVMDLIFNHLQSCLGGDRFVKVFEMFLRSFEITVFAEAACNPRLSQFVLFYACSLDQETCGEQFVRKLLEIFKSDDKSKCERRIVVSYLGSYLCRANFLGRLDVMIILESLVDWCCTYCEKPSDDHGHFYAACEEVLRVISFRMSWILADCKSKSRLINMRLELIFKNSLKPLREWSTPILKEFLLQAKAADPPLFSGFHDLLESLPEACETPLDAFFPFHPFVFEKSDRFICPKFIYWSMGYSGSVKLYGPWKKVKMCWYKSKGIIDEQLADVLTKHLAQDKFVHFRWLLRVIDFGSKQGVESDPK